MNNITNASSGTCPRCGASGFDGFCTVCGFPTSLKAIRFPRTDETKK